MTLPMAFSLPGMAEAERITRSPAWISTWRWVLKAMRVRADMVSPWLPVVMMQILCLGRLLMWARSTSTPSGMFIYPSSVDTFMAFSMERPVTATLRPYRAATSMICWMRSTFEAKVVTMMRCWQPRNRASKESPTLRSLLVKPGRSTLVESASRASTPSLPSCPRRPRSIMPPWMGVGSILKSPVCTTVPTPHLMAKHTASAMEWLAWMNSTENLPALTTSPASQVMSLVLFSRRCSSSFSFTSPAVMRVA